MEPRAEPVVEHVEIRAAASQHEAFVAAYGKARSVWLAARGCRSATLTRGRGDPGAYHVRIEWRSSEEHAAFEASEAARAVEQVMAPFTRASRRLDSPVHVASGEGGASAIDPTVLRQAFGHYPTGVAVITAASAGVPVGMVVSSFTTVSLRPPLVAFCAAHSSTSWPHIADARFCIINVLEASQSELVKLLARKGDQRFESVGWSAGPNGAPVLDGVVGWLACAITEVRHAGDHDLVLLDVLAHELAAEREPLLFHRSGYRAFAATTKVKDDD